MQAKVIPKTLHYRRAIYLQEGGNLQNDLKKALAKAKTVGERKEVVNADENTVLLLNSVRNQWNMTFGSLLLYSQGRNQPLVTENDAATELKVEQLAPEPDETGARRDFIESLLFFGVLGNHVVLLQSAGLRARQLETHLAWLLGTKTETIGENDQVSLADKPSKNAISKVLKSPVKSVSIGVPLESKPITGEETKHATFRLFGAGYEVLKRLLDTDSLNKLSLSDSLDETRLKVQVQVTYTHHINASEQDLLNEIALGLRNQEPEDVTITLKDGGRLTGADLKVFGTISVQAYGGLVVPDDLYPQMRDWLKSQVQQGIVSG